MTYIIQRLSGGFTPDSRFIGRTSDHQMVDGPRPKEAQEFGGDARQLLSINDRVPETTVETRTRGGCGTGILVRVGAFPIDRFEADGLAKNFGITMETLALICMVRGPGAPGSQGADVCAGIQADINAQYWAFIESIEAGFFHPQHGAVRFLLPESLSGYQPGLDVEQKAAHEALGLSGSIDARMIIPDLSIDRIDNKPFVVSGEKASTELIQIAYLDLPGTGFGIRDTELRDGTPLNRGIVAICFTEHGPQMVQLGPDGVNLQVPIKACTEQELGKLYNAKVKSVMDVVQQNLDQLQELIG